MQAHAIALLQAALALQGLAVASAQSGASQVASAALPGELLMEFREGKVALGQVPAMGQEERSSEGAPRKDVHHKSWFERMGESLLEMLVGLFILIPFSIALLWVNERRSAQLEAVLGRAGKEVKSIPLAAQHGDGDLSENDGTLVHVTGESTKSEEPLQDQRFPEVRMEKGCMKLRSTVEVYQWEETSSERTERDRVGGGETTVTTYSYKEAWCSSAVDSQAFHEKDCHQNTVHVVGLEMGQKDLVNPLVKYGEVYTMPKTLVEQLNEFKLLGSPEVGPDVQFNRFAFTKKDEVWYHCPLREGQPEVGDVRVKFEYVPDGLATILALHMESDGDRTFGPYRSVSRGLCSGEDQLKDRRLEAARQDSAAIYEQEKCPGFCVCCNLVKRGFAQFAPPQVFSAWQGTMTKDQCLASEEASAKMMKWGLRVGGWLLLFIGHMMLWSPMSVFIDIIPFIGIYLSSILSYGVFAIAFFLTLFDAALIVSIAYTAYHPRVALICIAVCACAAGSVVYLSSSHVHSAPVHMA